MTFSSTQSLIYPTTPILLDSCRSDVYLSQMAVGGCDIIPPVRVCTDLFVVSKHTIVRKQQHNHKHPHTKVFFFFLA